MEFLHPGDLLVGTGRLGETLRLGRLGEVRVECRPLHLLAGCGGLQVVLRRPDHARGIAGGDLHLASLEVLEEHLGVFLLVFRRLGKNVSDLYVTFLPGRTGEIGVTIPRLGFPGERRQQIFLRLRSLECFCHVPFTSSS